MSHEVTVHGKIFKIHHFILFVLHVLIMHNLLSKISTKLKVFKGILITQRILENVNVCYLNRLQCLQIDTLEQRRIKADLSLFLKLYRNLVDTDIKEVVF